MTLQPPPAPSNDEAISVLAADRARARRSLLVLGIIATTIALLALNRQAITDWWTSLTFEPGQFAQQLTTDIGLTAEGERIFLMAQPEVVSSEELAQACDVEESSHDSFTSGCYTVGGRIWILEPSFEFPKELVVVTAAHEMLHAAWFRFDAGERDRMRELLRSALIALPADHWLLDRMSVYSMDAPEKEYEELFAVMGTEVELDLGTALEGVYARYLTDRKALVERTTYF